MEVQACNILIIFFFFLLCQHLITPAAINTIVNEEEAETLRQFIRLPKSNPASANIPSVVVPVYLGAQEGLKDADMISSLPGQPKGLILNSMEGT